MNRKALLISLPVSLMILLNGCTYEKSLSSDKTSYVDVKVQDTNESKQQPQADDKIESPKAIDPVKDENKPQPAPETSVEESVKEPSIIKQGDKGDKVIDIQQKLNKFGYKLAVDGSFGSSTHTAVIDFQIRNKLAADGIAGPATLDKLNKEPTAETMYKPPVSKPSIYDSTSLEQFINSKSFPSKTSFFIWIDIPKQRVNIFTGSNNNWKLLKSMVCSTGKSYTPTIKGNFAVGSKGSYFIADGGARCKWYTQINGNYLFHSVLYDNKGERIIDGTLGVPASHGCVRLATENAKFIYDTIPAGTAIWSN